MQNKKMSLLLVIVLMFTVAGCDWHQSLEGESSTAEIVSSTEESESDYLWEESDEVMIALTGDSADCDDDRVDIDDNQIKIEGAGTYRVSGELAGQFKVDLDEEDSEQGLVRLILDNVAITNEESSALYIDDAERVIIILAENSANTLSDSTEYVFEEGEDEPNATLFSKANLVIYGEGNGVLEVNANYADGIVSKDGLLIRNANLNVTSADDAIRGKNYLKVYDSEITTQSGGDSLVSNDEEVGYIVIENSQLDLTAVAGDAIVAAISVEITGGNYNLTTDGGSAGSAQEDNSMKGIKAGESIVIGSGDFVFSTSDDALHTNGDLVINGGSFNIASGDDGLHADSSITINGCKINITKSYEGIESSVITINDGEIHIVASDDGVNVAGGNDSSAMGRPGAGGFENDENAFLYINGGYIYVNANGDGLDSNGSVAMTGGTAIVDGPTNSGNGPLDYNGTFQITGGTLLAVGSSGMAQAPSDSSTQYSFLVNFTNSYNAGDLIHIENSAGETLLIFAPAKKYQSIVYSSAEVTEGETYNIYLGGSCEGEIVDGLCSGNYTAGELYSETITITNITTSLGSSGGMGGGMMGDGGQMNGGRDSQRDEIDLEETPEMGEMGEMPEGRMGGGGQMDFAEMLTQIEAQLTEQGVDLPENWTDMTDEEKMTYLRENNLMQMGGGMGGGDKHPDMN